ncbi:MAG: squalene--hopene cyclase [Armatimonadota bacterium]|nr:squalene--hopene cyclase [bacterium]
MIQAGDVMNTNIRSAQMAVNNISSDTLSMAVDKATQFLLKTQTSEGYWLGELEGDTILESEYIILMRFLGRGDETKLRKAAAYILTKQMDNGGWSLFPEGPVDVSSSVKAYWALKLTGSTGSETYMTRAREAIREAGGVQSVNSYTKFYLAMMGQVSWDVPPAVPPEIMLLPNWFYFNIYQISSWSRTFVVPLSIIWTHKCTRKLEPSQGIGELLEDQSLVNRRSPRVSFWRSFFIALDQTIKIAEKMHLMPLREIAVKKSEQWMLEHFEHSAGLGAIFPPMIYALIAMRALGYDDGHPQVQWAMDELEKLEIEEPETLRLQPCVSPVWDTVIAMNALADAGLPPDHPSLKRATEWVISKQVTLKGDWKHNRPDLEPGGWYFEFDNEFYPDIDDTAMVLMALRKTCDVNGKEEACRAAFLWLMGMQGSDGGWASFDVDNNRRIFNYIPFADHNAMLDPSTSDITARILEMMSFHGMGTAHGSVSRAIDFLRKEQEPDGSWYGRWGVNYVYGTWQALRGLSRIGVDLHDPMIQRSTDWLLSMQNEDGGWGESCRSYYDPSCKGTGQSTPSQTAWAVMGLISAGEIESDAVRAGIDYLIRTQKDDGTWDEEWYTGAGFPKVFYLRYHLYRHSFPLMALGMYRASRGVES